LEELSNKALTKLDTSDILEYLSRFKNKRTLNRKLSSINALFHFCHKQNLADTMNSYHPLKGVS
jgi:integrase/recombinase XerD